MVSKKEYTSIQATGAWIVLTALEWYLIFPTLHVNLDLYGDIAVFMVSSWIFVTVIDHVLGTRGLGVKTKR